MHQVETDGMVAQPEILHTSQRFGTLMQECEDKSPETHELIQSLLPRAREAYGVEDEDDVRLNMLSRALELAVVCYGENNNKDKRIRKFSRLPYATHPVQAALNLLGGHPYEDVPRSFNTKPLPAEAVSAMLLHDVVEDVDLDGINGQQWLSVIQRRFAAFDDERPGASYKIKTYVEGLTDYTKMPDGIPQPLTDALTASPLIQSRAQIIGELLPDNAARQSELVDGCVKGSAAICRIIAVGKQAFEEPHKQLHAIVSMLEMKGADVVDNLGDHLATPTKLMRALELTILLRHADSALANQLVARLGKMINLDAINNPPGETLALSQALVEHLDHNEEPKKWTMSAKDQSGAQLTQDVTPTAELPILTTSEMHDKTSFGPQYLMRVENAAFLDAAEDSDLIEIDGGGQKYSAPRITSSTHDIMRAFGRRVVYFRFTNEGGLQHIVKVIDTQPALSDFTNESNQLDPQQIVNVPESGFFNPTPSGDLARDIVDIFELASPGSMGGRQVYVGDSTLSPSFRVMRENVK